MTVRTRLVLSMLGIAIVFVIPAAYATSQLQRVRDLAVEQRTQHAAAFLALGRFLVHLAELDRFQRSYIATPSEQLRTSIREAVAGARAQLEVLADAGYGEGAREAAARFDVLSQSSQGLERMVEAGRVEDATAFLEQVKPLATSLLESTDRMAAAIDQRSGAAVGEAIRIGDSAATTAMMAMLVALGAALTIGALSNRAITVPLRRLRRSMKTVAGGEFVAAKDLPYERHDEIGDLSRSYRSMTQRLAELDRLKAEFIGIATHDLRTPLTVIGGYAELMEQGVFGDTTEKQRSVLGSIGEQTFVLARMVTQLLDISRLEAGGFVLQIAPVNVRDLFDQIERTFEPLARKKSIELELRLEESVPRVINADGDRLRDQVLGNLLSNAFKFTPEGGRIVVRAWGEASDVRISVEDSGMGVPADHLSHIFERWHQAGEARSRGSGLGLTIVHGIVTAHGGTVTVESCEGTGTTFFVTLPDVSPATCRSVRLQADLRAAT